jgi:hypothetical protein
MLEALLVINGLLIGIIITGAYAKWLSQKQAEANLREVASTVAQNQLTQAQQITNLTQVVSDLSMDVQARRFK